MDYGGKHKVSVPDPSPPEGGQVFNPGSFDVGNPDVREEWPVDPMFNAADDPLAGKSGKDSLSEEEAQLS